MLIYIMQGITYGFAAGVQPGSFQTYLITQALRHGWRRTLPAIFAPLISDGPIITLVLLVLSQVPAGLVRGLQLAGGLFVLYLAAGAFKAWRNFSGRTADEPQAVRSGVFRAALVNFLNPAPYLFWSLVTGPLLITGWRAAPANAVGLLAGFYGAMLTSLAGITLLFTAARRFGPGVTRGLLGLSALVLAGFGCYQLWQGLAALRGG
jgi:threonine/homoserine/homoserine lactone efflux protein